MLNDNKTSFKEKFGLGAEAAWKGLKMLFARKGIFNAMDTVHDELTLPKESYSAQSEKDSKIESIQ